MAAARRPCSSMASSCKRCWAGGCLAWCTKVRAKSAASRLYVHVKFIINNYITHALAVQGVRIQSQKHLRRGVPGRHCGSQDCRGYSAQGACKDPPDRSQGRLFTDSSQCGMRSPLGCPLQLAMKCVQHTHVCTAPVRML